MLQNPRKTLGFKKNMVYEIPPGGGGKPYPASGLNIAIVMASIILNHSFRWCHCVWCLLCELILNVLYTFWIMSAGCLSINYVIIKFFCCCCSLTSLWCHGLVCDIRDCDISWSYSFFLSLT